MVAMGVGSGCGQFCRGRISRTCPKSLQELAPWHRGRLLIHSTDKAAIIGRVDLYGVVHIGSVWGMAREERPPIL